MRPPPRSSERLGDALEADSPARLHEHRVAGVDATGDGDDGGVGVGDLDHLRRAGAGQRGHRSATALRGPDRDDDVDAGRDGERARPSACSASASVAELAHLAEDGDPPPRHRQTGPSARAPPPSTSGWRCRRR